MGLFYLLTLYCFIRCAEGDSPIFASAKIGTVPTIRGASVEGSGARGQGSGPDSHPSSFILSPIAWCIGSVTACLLGMATKEVTISAPLIVLLYDRTFCAGSFRGALRRRCGLYLALAGTWILLGWLVLVLSPLGTSTGPGTREFTWQSYLLTQPGVILHYLRLSIWPWPLCLDYEWPAARTVADVLWPAIPVVGLLVLTIRALVKRPAWGFLGAWFFGILALTSSVLPLGQAAFEHRMYLPLAALITAAAATAVLAGRQCVQRGMIPPTRLPVVGALLAGVAAITLSALTFHRNRDFWSDLSIWSDTAVKAPHNFRAFYNLGKSLVEAGRPKKPSPCTRGRWTSSPRIPRPIITWAWPWTRVGGPRRP